MDLELTNLPDWAKERMVEDLKAEKEKLNKQIVSLEGSTKDHIDGFVNTTKNFLPFPPAIQENIEVKSLKKLLISCMRLNHELGSEMVTLIRHCEAKGMNLPNEFDFNSKRLNKRISDFEDKYTLSVEGID